MSAATNLDRTFAALADPTRRRVVDLLRKKPRRAKLFYLRRKTGKAARLTEKKTAGEATES